MKLTAEAMKTAVNNKSPVKQERSVYPTCKESNLFYFLYGYLLTSHETKCLFSNIG